MTASWNPVWQQLLKHRLGAVPYALDPIDYLRPVDTEKWVISRKAHFDDLLASMSTISRVKNSNPRLVSLFAADSRLYRSHCTDIVIQIRIIRIFKVIVTI